LIRGFAGAQLPDDGFPRPRSAPEPAHLAEPATSRRTLATALRALRPRPVVTVDDLLEHVPFRHEDYRSTRLLAEMAPGEEATVVCTVERVRVRPTRRRNLVIVEASVRDESGPGVVIWFNQRYLAKQLQPGMRLSIRGERRQTIDAEIVAKSYERADDDSGGLHTSGLVPVYPASERVSGRQLRALADELLAHSGDQVDPLPDRTKQRRALPLRRDALTACHRPETQEEAGEGRSRLAFDELLAEVRLTSRLRDERGLYSEVWAGRITRRAILAAGARLAAEGRLHEPAQLVEAGYEEMRSIIGGIDGPSADELAERARYRATYRASDAPPFLGSAPEPPPSLDGLPPAAARAMRATGAAIDALFGSSETESEAAVVRGIGASPGVYTGTARLVNGPAAFDRMQRGDILVTATTTESFNIVLPLLGAIVTDSGGLLSHAAIVSREYGIPGVVGTRDGTERITDGARVRVDGDAGEVTVLQ